MLTIRLKRIGRKNLVQYRVIVQDKQFSPKSGKIVENLGSYDPHTKIANVNAESAKKHLANGAQPSPRVQKIFKDQKITMPDWVIKAPKKAGKVKNPDKTLRKDKPEEAKQDDNAKAEPREEAPAGTAVEAKDEKPADEPKKGEDEKEDTKEKPDVDETTKADEKADAKEAKVEEDPKKEKTE